MRSKIKHHKKKRSKKVVGKLPAIKRRARKVLPTPIVIKKEPANRDKWKVIAGVIVSLISIFVVFISFRSIAVIEYQSEMNDGVYVVPSIASSSSPIVSVSSTTPTVTEKVVEKVTENIMQSEEIVRGDSTKNQIIFTFDGGSENISGEKILDVLESRNLAGTFFLTGEFIRKYPELVRRMATGGHEIYNHTYSHPYLTELSDTAIKAELNNMESLLLDATGLSSKPFFRPPYGDRDERVRRLAYESGYTPVIWTFDAGDWRQSEGMTSEMVRAKIFSNISPGAIVLMHIGDSITGEILADVIDSIQKEGYLPVPLSMGI